ncbi:MAG: hydroxylamine oxidoreductase [Nitrospinota bacterium]|nr:hydroxylamine oxidoreductase [Nitrospinota bacterium]
MRSLAALSLTLLFLGAAVVMADGVGKGIGLYGGEWSPDPMSEYWDPKSFHTPRTDLMEGVYRGEECVDCHEGITPGIVTGWRASRHAAADQPVSCPACHGADHQKLILPTPETCAGCHEKQHGEFMEEKRFGFPSHALAMERAVDAKHFVDKPKAETASCLHCHSVATKCDSCHTRHLFSAAEARRPEACVSCHSGPPHPDDETYYASAHGKLYLAEGDKWDWSKPLAKGNYPAPTCAYCHMYGKHQVADKAIWKFGLREVNPNTSENKVKRAKWRAVCRDCHDDKTAEEAFSTLDKERKRAWGKLYAMEDLLEDLRSEKVITPAPGQRPAYPTDFFDSIWPMIRIGFLEGQASAFYNVSLIERLYFEMWYFDNLGAYKGAAHGADEFVNLQHQKMESSMKGIRAEAARLRHSGKREPGDLWLKGEYTDFNRENN